MKEREGKAKLRGKKFIFFWTGYARTPRQKFLYALRRFCWCGSVLYSIRYWVFIIYTLISTKVFAFEMLAPAICATLVAILFARFD